MTQARIVWKLEIMLHEGIRNEHEAISFMVRIRKLIELQKAKKRYEILNFHCDWAVHAMLDKSTSQKILAKWDEANVRLRVGMKLSELPPALGREIEKISKMEYFEEQLEDFLKANGLPSINATRPDGWSHFLHFYSQVVEESPLESKDAYATVATVTLNVELADEEKLVGDDMWYKVTWRILDKNGLSGDIFVLNTFSLNPEPPEEFETHSQS